MESFLRLNSGLLRFRELIPRFFNQISGRTEFFLAQQGPLGMRPELLKPEDKGQVKS